MENRQNIVIASAPGRINIIGEHTDYNDGFVLPAAINKKTVFKLSRNGTEKNVNIISKDFNEKYSFDIDNFSPVLNGWRNYVMGVVDELQKLGGKLSGFNGEFEGDVPIGSGMSSSAALECSLSFGLNKLFNLGFDEWQLIKVGQMAEHNYVGVKCGIMDQFASAMGKKNQVMLLDTQSLEFKYFPFDLGEFQLLLMNTNVSHTLSNSAYNTRREECREAVDLIKKQFTGIDSLRDVSPEILNQCAKKMPENVFQRSRHVITENERVILATKAILKKEYNTLGELMYSSHLSLQNDYDVSCPELNYLVESGLNQDYVLGSRMMGGGFGGCTINVIHKKYINRFVDHTKQRYYERFKIEPTSYLVSIEDGTRTDVG